MLRPFIWPRRGQTFLRFIAVYFLFLLAYALFKGDSDSVFYPGAGKFADAWVKITAGGIHSRLAVDLGISIMRVFAGIALAGVLSLVACLAIVNGRGLRWFAEPVAVTWYKIPFLALFPILLMIFGTGEWSKILIVFSGLFPLFLVELIRQSDQSSQIFAVQLKHLRLKGWRKWYYFDFLGLLKTLFSLVGQNLTPAWLYLLVAETSGVQTGVGYRIFLNQRYLLFAEILIYVAALTLVSVLLYALIQRLAESIPSMSVRSK